MKQTKCAFHSNENLVNFCRNPQCLLPMCPSCVKIHSAEHIRLGTHGYYDCISDIQVQVQSTLQTTLKSLISNNNELKDIYEGKQNQRSKLVNTLKQMRFKILDSINKYIDDIQQEALTQINSIQSSSAQQFSQIELKIQKITSQAQSQIENLNSDKKIKTIISHISSNMPAYYHYSLNQVSSKVNQLKSNQLNINKVFQPNQLNQCLKVIGQCYQVNFIQPIKRKSMKKIQLRDSNVSKMSKQCSTQGSYKKVL